MEGKLIRVNDSSRSMLLMKC